MKDNNQINEVIKPTIASIEGTQALTNGLEMNQNINSEI